jgi:hypothetical protein
MKGLRATHNGQWIVNRRGQDGSPNRAFMCSPDRGQAKAFENEDDARAFAGDAWGYFECVDLPESAPGADTSTVAERAPTNNKPRGAHR